MTQTMHTKMRMAEKKLKEKMQGGKHSEQMRSLETKTFFAATTITREEII
jgi:hypothetical protein